MAAPCALWFGDQAERVVCPYDAHHRMPASSLQRHAASCRLRRMGYSKEEQEEMYDSSFFYEKLKIPTITMDKDLQFHIVQQAKAESAKEGVGYNQGFTVRNELYVLVRLSSDQKQKNHMYYYYVELFQDPAEKWYNKYAVTSANLMQPFAAPVNSLFSLCLIFQWVL